MAVEPEDADFDWTWRAQTPEAFYWALTNERVSIRHWRLEEMPFMVQARETLETATTNRVCAECDSGLTGSRRTFCSTRCSKRFHKRLSRRRTQTMPLYRHDKIVGPDGAEVRVTYAVL